MARPKRARRPEKRSPAKRSSAKRSPARPPESAPPQPPHPAPSETALLTLARALTALTTSDRAPRAAVTTALDVLGSAFAPGAPLPRALAQARNAALADETRALAIAWSREQLRLSLGEILARATAAGDLRVGLAPEPLAWLVLAACEALADEPREAAPDRVRLLAEWLTGP